MEFEDLKTLSAASLLAPGWRSGLTDEMIKEAVKDAQRIWNEVLRQERER